MKTTNQQLKEINAFTLKQWLDNNEVLLIDVREPGEFAVEHISGAKLMPLSQFAPTVIPQDSNKKIVLQCQSGNRSDFSRHLWKKDLVSEYHSLTILQSFFNLVASSIKSSNP